MAARRLAEAGIGVVCLEQGDWPDRAGFRGAEPDWELTARKQWSSSPDIRAAPSRLPDRRHRLATSASLNFNGVGGGTVLYAAAVAPAAAVGLPGALARRGRRRLADLLRRARCRTTSAPTRDSACRASAATRRTRPVRTPRCRRCPIGDGGPARRPRARTARLALVAGARTRSLSAPYEGRHACVQRGTCIAGLQRGRQGVHRPDALAAGDRARRARSSPARASARIVVDGAGSRPARSGSTPTAASTCRTAAVVLCAANGIGTARLLLAVGVGRVARRPGQLVGAGRAAADAAPARHRASGVFDESSESWQGQFGSLSSRSSSMSTSAERDFAGGSKWSLAPTGGPLGAVAAARSQPGARRRPPHVRTRSVRAHRGVDHCCAKTCPTRHNRVELSTDAGRLVGDPRARGHYRSTTTPHRS